MTDKIGQTHLARSAIVYVRQSSMTQVRENLESQRRQYGLVDRAKLLGFGDVKVIDDDLGRSGSGLAERPGFAKLVALLCEGVVGAIFVIEASRIARNGRDWHHVIDLCALTGTLLVDHDGIYEPKQLNDRMLLGLKGTMAEFELGLIRQRCREALKGMLARGAVMWRPPVGFVRDRQNRLDKTPDLQVQQAVQTVFDKFVELGSARQVFLWFRNAGLQLPSTVRGTDGLEVRWWPPSASIVLGILKNPFYAGTFVWPQRTSNIYIEDGRARTKPGARLPPEKWQVVLHNQHPGFIAWDVFERNQKQLMENDAKMHGTRRAATYGDALFAGLLRCGHCGLKLRVLYASHARYRCGGGEGAKQECVSFGNLRFDAAVATTILQALGPLGIEASVCAWRDLRTEQDSRVEALRLTHQRAAYETRLARRRYEAIDPDNRLVASELERRWNDALVAEAAAHERLDQAVAGHQNDVTEEDERRLRTLGTDLEKVWHHPDAPMPLKKRILRTAVEEIIVTVDKETSELALVLRWAGGAHTTMRIHKHRSGRNRRALDPAALDQLRALAEFCDDTAIARILNMNGLRTGPGNPWTESRVRAYRDRHQIPVFKLDRERTWVTMVEAATLVGVAPATIRRFINQSVLKATQVMPNAPWQIEREALQHASVVAAIASVRGPNRSRRDPQQGELL